MRLVFVRWKALKNQPDLAAHFNSGDFARDDYKNLYIVKMWRGSMRVFLRTPSLSQIWYTIKELLFGEVVDGQAYSRHGHPVQLQVYNLIDVARKYMSPAQIKAWEQHQEKAKAAAKRHARKHAKSGGKRNRKRL